MLDMDRAREVFEDSEDFTIGIEEEFQILDPETLDLVQRFEELRDAAEADPPLAEIPAGRLRSLTRLRVVGEHADERPAAGVVEGGEEERQQRLGHARRARFVQECAQAFAPGELPGDRRERRLLCLDRLVHDNGRNAGFRGVIVAASRPRTMAAWPASCSPSGHARDWWRHSTRRVPPRPSGPGGSGTPTC